MSKIKRPDGTREWIRQKRRETDAIMQNLFKHPCPKCNASIAWIWEYPPVATRWEAPKEVGWECRRCGHIFDMHPV